MQRKSVSTLTAATAISIPDSPSNDKTHPPPASTARNNYRGGSPAATMALDFDALSPVTAILTHVVGAIVVVMVMTWSLVYRGGVAWTTDNKTLIFNWHPILMLAGFVFVSSEAILVYRLFPGNKQLRKTVHSILNAAALLAAVIGIWAAVKYHNESGIMNFYSLHSWFGLLTVLLFAVQWVFGLVTFLYPGASVPTRQVALPWHTFLGVFIYILALTTASQGILEKLTFLFAGGLNRRSGEAIFANILGLLVFALGGLVILTAVKSDKIQDDEAFRALE